MSSPDRRDFLKLCLASAPALLLPDPAKASSVVQGPAQTQTHRVPSSIDRFIDPLPRLQQLEPHRKHGGITQYRVRMVEFSKQMHSQLPPTRLWGYNGQYPGPVFEVMRNERVEVQWENQLPAKHLFEVDTRIHGAMAPSPAVRTVPHLHGSRTTSVSDGLPENWFTPGRSEVYSYPNDQQAAPLWYHDHAVGITRLNVYAGLSGVYLLRDEYELSLKLPSGEFEIPLILQDRSLDEHGQLIYTPSLMDGTRLPPGEWGPEFFGDYAVVNGAITPYLAVQPRPYRFRVLNGANSRFFNLYLNLASHPTDIPKLVGFHQIGSDGGFLGAPVKLTSLLMAPAERTDLIVDFTGLEGKTLTLSNNAAAPYPGWSGMSTSNYAPLEELMKIRVSLPQSKSAAFSLPALAPVVRFDRAEATVIRDFVLTEQVDTKGRSSGVRINDKGYDYPVTELPKLNAMERWRFINTTDDAHPMHLHLVQFQILERQGFDLGTFTQGKLELVGKPRPPAANEAGWKDTAIVLPGEVLSILARFEGYTGRYVFHCHMLEHEDNDMMRPFEVVAST